MSSYITWLQYIFTVKIFMISLTISTSNTSRVKRIVGGVDVDCGKLNVLWKNCNILSHVRQCKDLFN